MKTVAKGGRRWCRMDFVRTYRMKDKRISECGTGFRSPNSVKQRRGRGITIVAASGDVLLTKTSKW
jgi:hypothetical protein